MSEWLGKSRIEKEDIEKVQPSIVKYFPMVTRYFIDAQKLRVGTILDYGEGEKFKAIVEKVYGTFNASTVHKAAEEAVRTWMQSKEQKK